MDNEFDQESIFAGRYRLSGKLGEGGIGVVFKALDTKLDKVVAVKTLQSNVSSQEAIRLQLEAKAIAKLDHTNILKVYDFGITDDGTTFLVMDYLEGKSLSELLEEKSFYTLKEAKPIIDAICDGLEHAHSHGIIHRDLKPSNMIIHHVEGKTELKILDFGLAKVTQDQSHTKTGIALGTPGYVCPEQAEGKEVDYRADIYSLGCLIFELLSGRTPFQAESPLSLMLMQSQMEAPILSEVAEQEIPEHIDKAVAKCLAKDKEDRIQSIREIKEVFRIDDIEPEISVEESIEEKPQAPKQGGVNKLLLASLAALAFLVGSVALYLVLPQDSPKKTVTKKKRTLKFRQEREEGYIYWDAYPSVTYEDVQYLFEKTEGPYRLIRFVNTKIDGKVLELLANKSIVSIDFTNCPNILDEDLKKLSQVNDLTIINMGRTKISKVGIKNLAPLNLTSIHLEFCKNIDDEALALIVKQWPHLEKLDVSGTLITEKGALTIGKLNELKNLYISNLNLNPDNANVFLSLPLEVLKVEFTGLDYDTILNFRKIKSLRVLSVLGCKVSTKKLKKLRRIMPWCEILDWSEKNDNLDKIQEYAQFLDPDL